MSLKETCIEVQDLQKYYKLKNGKTLKAVDGISLTINKGEICGIVGESGCGKSTLGRCMMRLEDITGGLIFFEGTDISVANRKKIYPLLKKIQMVFQNPYSSFNPKLKISYSLREPCKLAGMSNDEYQEQLDKILDEINLSKDEIDRYPHELSGGQLQRLAIARALLLKPDFIIADEPVSALDVSVQAQILNLLLDLKNELHLTMMFISHDITVVEHICDQIAVIYLGRIVEKGPAQVVVGNPLHPYTKALFSAVPKIGVGDDKDKERIILQGDLPSAIDLPSGCHFSTRCNECTRRCTEEETVLKEVEPGHFVACHKYSS